MTWNQLAAIRAQGQPEQPDRDPIQVIHAHDLAGLYGLEEASLFFGGTRWQPELLAHVPRLRRLWLETTLFLEPMPAGALNAVPLPALTHLTVVGESLPTLPVDWLGNLPSLTHLDLYNLLELPPEWLPDLPALTHLTVESHSLKSLLLRDGSRQPIHLQMEIPQPGELPQFRRDGTRQSVVRQIQHCKLRELPPLRGHRAGQIVFPQHEPLQQG